MTRLLATLLALAVIAAPSAAQFKGVDPGELKWAFLNVYRPKARALLEHGFRNVTMTTTRREADPDTGELTERCVTTYRANGDRYPCRQAFPDGREWVWVRRPDARYAFERKPGGPYTVTTAEARTQGLRWLFPRDDWWAGNALFRGADGFGIGVIEFDLAAADYLARDAVRVDRVEPLGTDWLRLSITNTRTGRPETIDFLLPHYIVCRTETHFGEWSRVFDHRFTVGETLDSFRPESITVTGPWYDKDGNPVGPARVATVAVVTDFRKTTHPESLFAVSEYGTHEVRPVHAARRYGPAVLPVLATTLLTTAQEVKDHYKHLKSSTNPTAA